MTLENYREKRDFQETPEPLGEPEAAGAPLRFVVHKHHARRLHYDLRLEAAGVLKSWAVPKGPSMTPKDKRLAVMVEDHPLDYISFKGEIPEGNYGAGQVEIWDEGAYQPVVREGEPSDQAVLDQIAKGHLTFILSGNRLKGEFALIHKGGRKENEWLLIKARDRFSTDEDVTATPTVDIHDAPEADMPSLVKPMLATLAEEPFDREGWAFETKWDGYRALAEVRDGEVRLYSRNGLLFNDRYPELIPALSTTESDAIFDGEVVAVDEAGVPRFQLLQNYSKDKARLLYYVFDLLYWNGRDLRGLPLEKRKAVLKEVLPARGPLKYSDHVIERGNELFELVRKHGFEGVVAKKLDSRYEAGARSRNWLKVRALMRQEAVVGGFTEPRGSRQHLGALLMGEYRGKDLVYIGHSAGRLGDRDLRALRERLDPITRDTSPFSTTPKANAPAHWVEPRLVVEVQFAGWTEDGSMRQPIVLGVREDKTAREVRPEGVVRVADTGDSKTVQVGGKRLKLTNLSKVYWPDEGYTKGDLIEYYRGVADYILPYLEGRPESLNRFPDGITGESFYHKNVEEVAPDWAETVLVHSDSDNKDIRYLLCNDEATLVFMANLGCIEINPWFSRAQSLDRPDYLAIDLDPLEIGFEEVIDTAQAVREVMDQAGLTSVPKTSGATGLHIYVPLAARYTYEQARQIAEVIARLVNRKLPAITSVERNPAHRRGKVYLDFLQNVKGQTLAAPYCVRPVPGAAVSTPLNWDEVVSGLHPSAFTIRTIHERLANVGDLFAPVLGPGVDIEAALGRLTSRE